MRYHLHIGESAPQLRGVSVDTGMHFPAGRDYRSALAHIQHCASLRISLVQIRQWACLIVAICKTQDVTALVLEIEE